MGVGAPCSVDGWGWAGGSMGGRAGVGGPGEYCLIELGFLVEG